MSPRPTSLTAQRFRITFPDSCSVTGPVQGAGGVLTSLDRLLKAQRQATKGKDTGLYEPEPGCVAVYPNYNAWSNGPEYVAQLVGSKIEVVKS